MTKRKARVTIHRVIDLSDDASTENMRVIAHSFEALAKMLYEEAEYRDNERAAAAKRD